MENFGGDLELKRLDLTRNGQVDSVDLTAATLRSRPVYKSYMVFEDLYWKVHAIHICILGAVQS